MLRGRVTAMPPSKPDEQDASSAELQQWMERIRGGDEEAFGALFRATYASLCRHARMYVRSAAAAEDIVDDTFLKLWADRAQIRVQKSVQNYLHMAVRNRAINYVKRQRLESRYMETLPEGAEDASGAVAADAEDRLCSDEQLAMLRSAIEALPPRTRQVYTLYCQHEMRYADIARVMGISVRTVEHQMARAVRSLWRRLGSSAR